MDVSRQRETQAVVATSYDEKVVAPVNLSSWEKYLRLGWGWGVDGRSQMPNSSLLFLLKRKCLTDLLKS